MGEICALFPIWDISPIMNIRDRIYDAFQVLGVRAEFLDPADFHITAVFAGDGEVDKVKLFDPFPLQAFSVLVDGIGVFDTPDGYAIHLTVRKNSELASMQNFLFELMDNGSLSNFSIPENYTPHITLAYSPIPITPFTISPFAISVQSLHFSDENHEVIMSQMLKSTEAGGSPMLEKSAPISVVEKGVRYNEEGDLIIPIIGIPFKGPVDGVKDLAGDWFHKSTDVGPLTEVMAFYDHGRDGKYIKSELKAMGLGEEEIKALGDDFGFGKRDIGVARRGQVTDDGIMYEIIVRRNTKYKEALYKAAKNGFLAGSSGSKSFEYDPEVVGKVDYAAVVEITLTPSPFNIEAAIQDKAVELKEQEVAKKAVAEEAKKPADAEAEVQGNEGDGEENVEKSTSPISEALKAKRAAVQESKAQEQEDEGEEQEEESTEVLKSIIQAQGEEITELRKSVENLALDLSKSLPELGELIAEALGDRIDAAVASYMAKSRLEKSVEGAVLGGKKQSFKEKSNDSNKSVVRHNSSAAMQGYPGS